MQYVKVKRSWMVSMADALRTANGSSDLMYPSQMLAAALAVEGGGTGVTIDKSLTKSGAAADAKATGDALAKKADTTAIPTVPTALKNPHALTFTGAVTGTYDGSAAQTVNIPTSSGSGGGLVVQIAGGSSDTSVADIKAAYDKGQAVYVYSVDDDCYATLQAATSSTAVFVSVSTTKVRVITIASSGDAASVSKSLDSGGSGTATQNVFYGTCSTTGTTIAKVAKVTGDFALTAGVVVLIKFTNLSNIKVPTMNVNNTGARSVYRVDGGDDAAFMWEPGAVVPFVYDGTNWLIIQGTLGQQYAYGAVGLSSATDGTSETIAATSKAVSSALAAAKAYADELIGGIENGAY